MSGTVGDNVARASGVIASAGGGGKCLQVLEYSTTGTLANSATGWAQIGSVAQAITPTAASSKIRLTLSSGISGTQNRGFIRLYYDVDGGGYNVCDPYGATSGSRTTCHLNLWDGRRPVNITILHTPSYSLTNVLTYQVWTMVTNSSYPIYMGKEYTDGSSDTNTARTQTILRVEEIAA
jgi:hypothetical protein